MQCIFCHARTSQYYRCCQQCYNKQSFVKNLCTRCNIKLAIPSNDMCLLCFFIKYKSTHCDKISTTS